MLVRFLGQLSLAVAILAIPQFSIETADSMFCASLARASEVEDFGERGEDGTVGQKGQNGRNSDSLTVFADGSPMTLDLSGENGFIGNSGTNGGGAICDGELKEKSNNLQASNGGHGGDGGDGGNGGHGGSLTVYTTEPSYLQQIYVVASGGEGGEPGQGGQGGQGCQCPVSNWNEQTCKGRPGSSKYSCTTTELQCVDGYDGRTGRAGIAGRNGRLGTLTVINLDKSLTPDRPQATLTMGELQDRGFTLSRNEWETKTGATSLLAPGSIVADEYQELVARHEHTVLLVWDASQPVADFADERITLSLDGENNPNLNFPDDLWLETSELKRDRVSEFFVFNAVREKDVTRLKHQGISGTGENLKLAIEDRAQKSNVLDTDFSIRYRVSNSVDDARFRRVFDYKTKYEGQVPPEAIEKNGDRFILNLGQLPIPPEYLQLGTAVEVQLVANRSFADKYSKEQKITVRDIIERN
ncbi:conserved hypothetical protein [Hyella patelloides LEGE 07179]|uniref:Collagen-like protein n=1 Tax=Hyella patelloides LEGE 07179 TaxID=945734 RepID=A0A563VZY8_9CYAN|nr:collagen-like protein [Hyella patelloides]VEP17014.1 conserved hypothetical protein [Hyella patelloides LEGE 07179]